jgi:hypothetical protein
MLKNCIWKSLNRSSKDGGGTKIREENLDIFSESISREGRKKKKKNQPQTPNNKIPP